MYLYGHSTISVWWYEMNKASKKASFAYDPVSRSLSDDMTYAPPYRIYLFPIFRQIVNALDGVL